MTYSFAVVVLVVILVTGVVFFVTTENNATVIMAPPETRTVTHLDHMELGGIFNQNLCLVDTNKGQVSMHTDSCINVQVGDTIVKSEYGYGWVRQ